MDVYDAATGQFLEIQQLIHHSIHVSFHGKDSAQNRWPRCNWGAVSACANGSERSFVGSSGEGFWKAVGICVSG